MVIRCRGCRPQCFGHDRSSSSRSGQTASARCTTPRYPRDRRIRRIFDIGRSTPWTGCAERGRPGGGHGRAPIATVRFL